MAFLEAQAWGQSFRSIVREGDAGDQRPADRAAAPEASGPEGSVASAKADLASQRASHWRRGVRYVSLAASFFLAFALGMTLKGKLHAPWRTEAPPAAQPGPEAIAEAPLPDNPSAADEAAPASTRRPRWGTVRVVADRDGDGVEEEFRMPAIDAPEADIEHWLRMSASTAPNSLLRELERRGYRVQSRRRLLPIPLEDGRRMYTPVQDVQVQYVGHEYQ